MENTCYNEKQNKVGQIQFFVLEYGWPEQNKKGKNKSSVSSNGLVFLEIISNCKWKLGQTAALVDPSNNVV